MQAPCRAKSTYPNSHSIISFIDIDRNLSSIENKKQTVACACHGAPYSESALPGLSIPAQAKCTLIVDAGFSVPYRRSQRIRQEGLRRQPGVSPSASSDSEESEPNISAFERRNRAMPSSDSESVPILLNSSDSVGVGGGDLLGDLEKGHVGVAVGRGVGVGLCVGVGIGVGLCVGVGRTAFYIEADVNVMCDKYNHYLLSTIRIPLMSITCNRGVIRMNVYQPVIMYVVLQCMFDNCMSAISIML